MAMAAATAAATAVGSPQVFFFLFLYIYNYSNEYLKVLYLCQAWQGREMWAEDKRGLETRHVLSPGCVFCNIFYIYTLL